MHYLNQVCSARHLKRFLKTFGHCSLTQHTNRLIKSINLISKAGEKNVAC